MNEYRADPVEKNGHITNSRAFVCANDDQAIVWSLSPRYFGLENGRRYRPRRREL
jgi:hypothetical protein